MALQFHRFIASSAADAIAQVRQTLGENAVVVDVRRPQMTGLARLWQKPRIEVLAHVPEKPPPPAQEDVFAELRRELREIRQRVQPHPLQTAPQFEPTVVDASLRSDGGWRIQSVLEQTGMLPVHAHRVLEELRRTHGMTAPRSVSQEIAWACDALSGQWIPAAPDREAPIHVFVGPPGSGKTTCLSKWLAQAVLVEERPAIVFRLDSHVANTAESLTVLCEILGVPSERFAPSADWSAGGRTVFIDLPGVNPSDADAIGSLEQQLARLPVADVHLVLNTAYDAPVLMGQLRGFSQLAIADVVATHLDEEWRWGKLWNLVMGGRQSLRFLSAGQNIPGDFFAASPERILARQFPRIPAVSSQNPSAELRGKSPASLNPA